MVDNSTQSSLSEVTSLKNDRILAWADPTDGAIHDDN